MVRRPEPPVAGDEIATLLGSLERQRATFAWKCSGIDDEQLRATVGASTLTLGGLLLHAAFVEDIYFSWRLGGADLRELWPQADLDEPGWEWTAAATLTAEQLIDIWQQAVRRSRAVVASLLADGGGLDQLAQFSGWDQPPSLRRILADLIEELARHTGHADLIREAIDGAVGEDPPDALPGYPR
jgi:uncharacterized damage-inducible protein DinB